MSFANETVSSRSASAFEKAGSMQPAKSQKAILAARAQPALAANTDSARSPLVNKLKPKQPYLKRGTGLQSRLTAAKHRRYVPKGGFIKGQAEDEGCQLHNAATAVDYSTNTSTISSHPSQPQHPDLPRELVESECAGSSLEVAEQCMANETSHALQQHIYAQFAHPHQANSFGAAQFHATADIEAELDADTALVHFPHGRHDDQDMPAQNSHKQHLESRRHREDPQDVPDRQGNQNFMHAAAGNFHHDSLAGQLAATGVSDWQMQQAAEVCSSSSLYRSLAGLLYDILIATMQQFLQNETPEIVCY